MTFSWSKFLFWLYLLFLVVADATVISPADPDLWHRLALGEALWHTGHFPPGDVFSYLADYQLIPDHEWGSAVIFYLLYLLGGLQIFIAVKVLMLGLTLVFMVRAGLQGRKPSLYLAAFYAIVLWALLPSFQSTVRCMEFTHVFLAIWLYWFQRERHGRVVSLWWYIATMLVWANLHGGFAIGLAWLFLVGISEVAGKGTWRPWALRLASCSLVTLINPFGWNLWIGTLRALAAPRQGFGEWAPVNWWPDYDAYLGYKILLVCIIPPLLVQLVRLGRKRIDGRGLFLLGFFLLLSLSSGRHTSLFALVAGALLPGYFIGSRHAEEGSHPLRRLTQMAARSACLVTPLFWVLLIPKEGFVLAYPIDSCPVTAVEYLRLQNVRGNLLVPFNYGSYALWELRGKMRVSMDGRYDLVYKPGTYRRVDDFFFARGDWKSLLTRPPATAVLVPITDPVYAKLQALPGWREAWHDPTDAVFLPR